MKREIKFKGNAISNNELVFGFFFITQVGYFVGSFNDEVQCFPDSVGEFTGFIDKNGKEIYEGIESVKLIIIGVGEGLADIVMHEGKWCVYETSQGYAPLYDLLNGNSTEIVSTLTQN